MLDLSDPPDPSFESCCVLCRHSTHPALDFVSGGNVRPVHVGEICFGCPDCERVFGLIGDVLSPST